MALFPPSVICLLIEIIQFKIFEHALNFSLTIYHL